MRGLPGPNGAGKITTLEMLEGISWPTSGQITYKGRALDHAFRDDIGIQFRPTPCRTFRPCANSWRCLPASIDALRTAKS